MNKLNRYDLEENESTDYFAAMVKSSNGDYIDIYELLDFIRAAEEKSKDPNWVLYLLKQQLMS